MPSVGRVYPSLADCAPPPPSSRRACQPFLKGRPPHNMLFPVNPPKSGAPHSSAFAPPGQTASPPHPRSAPCPAGQGSVAPRAQFRPITLPPPPPQAQDQRFHPPPTSPSPKNRRRRQAPARGPAAVCALHRPTRNAKKHPCPLLVGHGCVASEPTALAAGTAGTQAAGPCSWVCRRLCPPPPHQKRKEAPMPPARGAWARQIRAEGYWPPVLPAAGTAGSAALPTKKAARRRFFPAAP